MTIQDWKFTKGAGGAKSGRTQGPLIIGQEETGLENAFSNVALNATQPVNTAVPMMYPQMWAPQVVWPYYWPQVGNRSFANHRELQGTQVPSPLNLQKSNYIGPESTETSPYSPGFSPYVDYGVQSPLWSPYTPATYTLGAIGQERGVSMLSPYSSMHPYQQRSPAKYLTRSPHDYSSGHHNVVDIERIRQGLDVRTTVRHNVSVSSLTVLNLPIDHAPKHPE